MFSRTIVLCIVLFCASNSFAQSATYIAIVGEGRQRLASGAANEALAKADAAIKIAPERWEAYAVGTAALIAMKECEAALAYELQAFRLAPQDKRGGVKDLFSQCVVHGATASATPTVAGELSARPTQNEIVLWKTIENSRKLADFDAYLKEYPNGAFAALARQRKEEISRTAPLIEKLGLSVGMPSDQVQNTFGPPDARYEGWFSEHFGVRWLYNQRKITLEFSLPDLKLRSAIDHLEPPP